MKKLIVLMAVIMAACLVMPVMAQPALTSGADSGVAKLSYGPDKWIDLHLLFQMQYTNTFIWDQAAAETDSDGVWASDFAPARMRIMFNGQVAPNLTFFVETDIHKPTATDNTPYDLWLQDAYINYKFADEFNISFGMILLPFMHHNRQSAVSLLGVNYNTQTTNFPESWNAWRDFGVEFRGLLANKMIDYRIGVFDGIERDANGPGTDDDINPSGLPRVTGRIQVNLMDAEEGFFYSGNYLGKKRIVSFGGGVDYMKEATQGTDAVEDYMAWTVDLTVDYPINPNMVLAFQAAYVAYTWSPAWAGVEDASAYFAQAGLLLNGQFQPVLKYETLTREYATGDDINTYLYVGFNYFINGHNANVKIEYRHPMGENDTTGVTVDQADESGEKKFTLQAQIFI